MLAVASPETKYEPSFMRNSERVESCPQYQPHGRNYYQQRREQNLGQVFRAFSLIDHQ
jgi:hypothetical protein